MMIMTFFIYMVSMLIYQSHEWIICLNLAMCAFSKQETIHYSEHCLLSVLHYIIAWYGNAASANQSALKLHYHSTIVHNWKNNADLMFTVSDYITQAIFKRLVINLENYGKQWMPERVGKSESVLHASKKGYQKCQV